MVADGQLRSCLFEIFRAVALQQRLLGEAERWWAGGGRQVAAEVPFVLLVCFFWQFLGSGFTVGGREYLQWTTSAECSQTVALILGVILRSVDTERACCWSRWFALNDGALAWAKKATKIGKYPDAHFSLCGLMPSHRASCCVPMLPALRCAPGTRNISLV